MPIFIVGLKMMFIDGMIYDLFRFIIDKCVVVTL